MERPSRRTLVSVRSTERLMEVIDEAENEAASVDEHKKACELAKENGTSLPSAPAKNPLMMGRSAGAHVMRYVTTLTAANIYEVLLAMPFSYAIKLITFVCEYFEAPVRALLILVQVHSRQLLGSQNHRELLVRLQTRLRGLLKDDQERIGYNIAALTYLQREMKMSKVRFHDGDGSEPAKRTKVA